ncbi:MAG TPA: hypothetical protein VG013_32280 [Gemmataceae bacterium]|jgi:hypothetical protein|nr:hypothetical protein [Gemmataceae bacterium]
MAITEAAILERIIEPQEGELTYEAARFLLSLDFREGDRQRLEHLTARASQGALSAAEQADLDTYHRVSQLLARMQAKARQLVAATASPQPQAGLSQASLGIPPGILRSQEAFWRDLPELLTTKRDHGKWVAYHGDERIGIARTQRALIRECLRRGLSDDAYYLDVIEPHPLAPWEVEDIAPLRSKYSMGDAHVLPPSGSSHEGT